MTHEETIKPMENKDWREDEFKMWFLDNCITMSDLNGRAHNVMKFNAIKLYIESLLKSNQEEIEKAIEKMPNATRNEVDIEK